MRTIVIVLSLLFPRDTLSVLFWNVENFFDWRNDSTTVSDLEFSPAGGAALDLEAVPSESERVCESVVLGGRRDGTAAGYYWIGGGGECICAAASVAENRASEDRL